MNRILSLPFILISTAGTLLAAPAVEPAPAAHPKPVRDNILTEARQLAEKGDLLAAKEKYKMFLAKKPAPSLKREIRKELEAVNCKILFSKTVTTGSILYEVKQGDSLYKIAKEHGTTPALIQRSNQTGFVIYPGQKFKVVVTPFFIKVNLKKNRLYLYHENELVKSYPVATGQNNTTPAGEFTIENKLVNPTWYRTGAVVPPDSPDNILGTRWMGFSIPSYGIHGTTKPESIGKSTSAGCIRMLNEDVEELYDIIPPKTKVLVVKE